MQLRNAGTDAGGAFADLHAACFPHPWSMREFHAFLDRDGAIALIAEDEEETAIGFLLGWQVAEEAEILAVGVRPEWQGKGIGRALASRMVNEVHAQGGRMVFLEVGVENAAARALYASLGFESIGRRKAYYREADGRMTDAVTMRLHFLSE